MPSFGITDFYSSAQRQEFARKFQFKIQTLGPLTEEDLIYFTTTTLPGKTISNQTVPYMGVTFNVPGTVSYEGSSGWSVTFRCDEASNIRSKLMAWQTEIFDVNTSSGKYGVPIESAVVQQLGKDLKPLRTFRLIGIYPVKVGDLSYDVTNNGEPQTFEVSFAYQYWEEI